MLIIAASPSINISTFISLIRESNCDFNVDSFKNWQQETIATLPKAFVYIRVSPETALKRLLQQGIEATLKQIQVTHEINENYFIHKTTISAELKKVPVLVLNGTINFETDFSQFYTHLFSIKKFFKELKDQEDKEKGVYVAPKKKQCGCKC